MKRIILGTLLIFLVSIGLVLFVNLRTEKTGASFGVVILKLDPDYITRTKRDRLFRPGEPFTPFDDIVCELTTTSSSSAEINGSSFNGSLIIEMPGRTDLNKDGKVDQDDLDIFDRWFIWARDCSVSNSWCGGADINHNGEVDLLIDREILSDNHGRTDCEPWNGWCAEYKIRSGLLEQAGGVTADSEVYQWKIPGWPNGWIDTDYKMEMIIKSGGKVLCEVSVGGIKIRSIKKPKSSCVHLWGSSKSPYKFVYMRTESTIGILGLLGTFDSPAWFVGQGEEVRKNGFNKVDPFREYKAEFSHYVDLKIHNDQDWYYTDGVRRGAATMETRGKIPDISKCEIEASAYFVHFGDILREEYLAYTGDVLSSPATVWFNAEEVVKRGLLTSTYVHETGHFFCGLRDEYFWSGTPKLHTNCWPKGGVGSATHFVPYGERSITGCSFDNYWKPSEESLMNVMSKRGEGKFNVPSCGHCLYSIGKGVCGARTFSFRECRRGSLFLKEKFDECCNLDTVKPANCGVVTE